MTNRNLLMDCSSRSDKQEPLATYLSILPPLLPGLWSQRPNLCYAVDQVQRSRMHWWHLIVQVLYTQKISCEIPTLSSAWWTREFKRLWRELFPSVCVCVSAVLHAGLWAGFPCGIAAWLADAAGYDSVQIYLTQLTRELEIAWCLWSPSLHVVAPVPWCSGNTDPFFLSCIRPRFCIQHTDVLALLELYQPEPAL